MEAELIDDVVDRLAFGTEKRLSGVHVLRDPGNPRRRNLWVAEILISYDEGPSIFGVSILAFRGDKIARESIYVTEGWEPLEWRAQWRAAP